jgi:mannitol-1-/sugar-/sorbitol-6-phosphatase
MTVVLSDLDGVLVDSHASIMRAWRRWGRAHGVEFEAIDAVRHGSPTGEIVAALAPDLDVAAEARALDLGQAEDSGDVVALPGAADLLRALGPDAVAVVTSCTAELAVARLRAGGLEPPPVLVTSDRLHRGKPDPEGYLLAARELGADPGECVVLEDSPGGVRAGRDAGMRVVGLLTTHAADDLDGAHERVASIAEWLARVTALSSEAAPRARHPGAGRGWPRAR